MALALAMSLSRSNTTRLLAAAAAVASSLASRMVKMDRNLVRTCFSLCACCCCCFFHSGVCGNVFNVVVRVVIAFALSDHAMGEPSSNYESTELARGGGYPAHMQGQAQVGLDYPSQAPPQQLTPGDEMFLLFSFFLFG